MFLTLLTLLNIYNCENSSIEIFTGDIDRFKGITINSRKQNSTMQTFPKQLRETLKYWLGKDIRVVWFQIHDADSYCVPELTKQGFTFHHAKKSFVLMYKWCVTTEMENIPSYAHTMIGVGCLVINSQNEILVVCERFPLIPNSWKMPGGYVEPNEDFYDAAIREVCEETGIKTKFLSVVSLRHLHNANFKCSELSIVIALEPITNEIVFDKLELSDAKWMPVDEFLQCPQVFENNREFVKHFLENQENGINMICQKRTHQLLKKEYQLYFLQKNSVVK